MALINRFLTLNTGTQMPLLGLGTFLSGTGEVSAAVKTALALGYRHIDCAEDYENQAEIGNALQEVFNEGKIKREDIFVTSKLLASKMNPGGILEQFNKTLSDLKLSYLDLYLIHQPVPCRREGSQMVAQRGFGIHEVWRVLETIYESGKVKAIGVSNFPTVILNDLLNYAKIKPAINQIERTPYLTQKKHVKFCKDNGVQITSYSPFGNPALMLTCKPNVKPLLKNEVLEKIAQKYKRTKAQVLLRWQIQEGFVVIPKSTNADRIKENSDVWDFTLEKEDMEVLDGLDEGLRYFDQDWHGVPTFT